MSNLDLTIAEIMHGDTQVLKIMKGDKQKWPKLPYDAEVEYLQCNASNGKAYIDTGIKLSSDVHVYVDSYVFDTDNTYIFGGRVALSNGAMYVRIHFGNSATQYFYGNASKNLSNSPSSRTYICDNTSNSRIMYVNSTSIACTANTFSNDYTIYLFAMNGGGSASQGSNASLRISVAKMWVGSTLVRDFIPVRVGQVGYMYDKVSGELFGNANSTGSFILGNDV